MALTGITHKRAASFPEAAQTHARAHARAHTHTPTTGGGRKAKVRPQVTTGWHRRASSTKAPRARSRVGTVPWATLPGEPAVLCLQLARDGAACPAKLTTAERGRVSGTTRRACRGCLGDMGSAQAISVLAARAALLCGQPARPRRPDQGPGSQGYPRAMPSPPWAPLLRKRQTQSYLSLLW